MNSACQFAIMSLHGGQKYYHEVCTNYLSHSSISSIVSGKGSIFGRFTGLPSHTTVFGRLVEPSHNQIIVHSRSTSHIYYSKLK